MFELILLININNRVWFVSSRFKKGMYAFAKLLLGLINHNSKTIYLYIIKGAVYKYV